MTSSVRTALRLLVAVSFGACGYTIANGKPPLENSAPAIDDDAHDAQPKLLRISGLIDGSGQIVFTRDAVRYEHKHWARPSDMRFDGEAWPNLSRTPPAWRDVAEHLDLTKAWLVKRQGRDVIALEHTPSGFDLYLCDSPNSAAEYEITIAIPRRS